MSSISDFVFTPAVKAEQERLGSREMYERVEQGDTWWSPVVDERLREWLAHADSMYVGTSNADGQPYIQHRGGPRGFLKVLDDSTLAFADYKGNRQYVTIGNLTENPRATIFLMNYQRKQRLKLWGRMEIVEGDEALVRQVADEGMPVENLRVIKFHLEAYDGNCPKHIPRLYTEEEVAELKARIAELEKTS